MNHATSIVATAAVAAALVGGISAGQSHSPASSLSAQTYQMYANVDAEGDLGSNHDAVSVKRTSTGNYLVKFARSIGSCAAVAQAGKAGGTDPVKEAVARVQPQGNRTFLVGFSQNGTFLNDPFMLAVTCAS